MRYEVLLASSFGEKNHVIELGRDASAWRVTLDGRPVAVDAVEIAPNTLSILLDGQSFEVSLMPSPDGTEGRQQIVAPMPGKVVRLLVKAGDRVEAGQGLLVVEAMKMQNEIRSPKGGTVERVLTGEGQSVNAGEVLCVIA